MVIPDGKYRRHRNPDRLYNADLPIRAQGFSISRDVAGKSGQRDASDFHPTIRLSSSLL